MKIIAFYWQKYHFYYC